jgi:two-component system KDP operon response regulator KdpE
VNNAPIVVVVEDEPSIRRFIRMTLEREGCQVHEAETLHRALVETGTRQPDLIILDLGLPDGDGINLIRDLRTWSQTPIIVVSARSSEAEKVEALDAGADDYLTKPFGTSEMMARVRAQLRRHHAAGNKIDTVLEFGPIRMDLARRRVEKNGAVLHLTPIEYRLLATLVSQPGNVLTHRQLLHAVWGKTHAEDHHYVRVYMGMLRKKIEEDPSQPRHIITETGVGYRFVDH